MYNEGCSEEELWLSGIGFDVPSDAAEASSGCFKAARNADMSIDWDRDIYEAPCWDSGGFTDCCAQTAAAECSFNGNKGKGTSGEGATSRWYDGVNQTHRGGPG